MTPAPEHPLVCATTFEPSAEQLRSLLSQLRQLSTEPVVFDNSSMTAQHVEARCLEFGVRYLRSGANVGTAGALNRFLQMAHLEGRNWLLYFDQDSRVSSGYAELVRSALGLVHARVAMLGSRISQLGDAGRTLNLSNRFNDSNFVIASGTLIRVTALLDVGGFDQDFRLDLVDHEACLRLRSLGWLIAVDQQRVVEHEIGRCSVRIPIIGVRVSRHPWWRRQAMWRNSVVLVKRYFWLSPTICVRHLLGRAVETLAASLYFRDTRYLTTAARGLAEGCRGGATRSSWLLKSW